MNTNTNENTDTNDTQTQAQNVVICHCCGIAINNDDEYIIDARGDTICEKCCDEHYFFCDCCDEYHHNDYLNVAKDFNNDEITICDDCKDEYYSYCDDCESLHRTSDLHKVYDNNGRRFVCDDCRDDNYTYCDECGNYYSETTEVRGCEYCNECFEEIFTQCDECGNVFNNDEVQFVDGRWLCDDCANAKNPIKNYHYHKGKSPIFHNESNELNALFLGFELEVANFDYTENAESTAEFLVDEFDSNERNFYFEHDGSLYRGFELISQPRTLASHKKYNWQEIFSHIIKQGGRSHDTNCCGLHVHINKAFLTATERRKLDLFLTNSKTVWEKIARRKNNTYATFKPADTLCVEHWQRLGRNCGTRYRALNFENSNTIEFRLFKGTLKYSTFLATLEIVDAICRYIKQANIFQCNKANFNDFIKFMQKAENKKTYKNALEYLKSKHI